MNLYIRSRYSARVMTMYAILAVVLVVLGRAHVHLPSFVTAVSQATPATVMIACGVATVSVFSLSGGYPLLEARSSRRIPALDLLVIASNVATFAVMTLVAHGWIPAVIMFRALLGFSASALLVTAVAGSYIGTSIPGILFIVFTLFGAQAGGGGEAWAFAIADVGAGFSWTLVALLSFAGGYAWLRHVPLDSE